MTVGIVTQPLEMNYGGILQNWALQQVLKDMGHRPLTIDAYERFTFPHYVYTYLRVAALRALHRTTHPLPQRYGGALRWRVTGEFIEQHIDKTHVMWNYERKAIKQYGIEALVVGSDQVWRARYNGDHIEDMYLRFAQGLPLKRVAYAASFGVDDWEYTPQQTEACAALAQQMDAISVREASGVALCHDHLGVEAQHVLDPTMLLHGDRYRAISDATWQHDAPYLAVYCLDMTPTKQAFFDRVAARYGLTKRLFSANLDVKLTVPQWLAMLANASMVITDSFHGTVFSILFGKPFYSLSNHGRGNTRLLGLLSDLGLQDRLLDDATLATVDAASDNINWQDVTARLTARRQASLHFLHTNL